MSTYADYIKFIKGKILSSGFSLENEAVKILRKSYNVRREVPFYDLDEEKGRRFDIFARKFFPDESKITKTQKRYSVAQYGLIIECKNVKGNIWVFSLDYSPGISIPEHISMNMGKKPDPVFNVTPIEEIKSIPYVSGYAEYVFDEQRSNKQTDNLYSAINTVTKATKHEKDEYKKVFETFADGRFPKTEEGAILHFTFLQPLIIFSGKIFITRFDEKEELIVEPAKYVQMKKGYVSKDYNENTGEIHIVTLEALEEYLQLIDQYYLQKENLIATRQDQFMGALAKVIDLS